MKLFLFFPILCAVFRALFIWAYQPYKSLAGKGPVLWHCFRYGFWWGMDFNAYVFLIPLVLLSLPGAFFPAYAAWGDSLRLLGGLIYSLVLYLAFTGKMLFYKHFHDIYNQTLKLGAKAENITWWIFFSIRTMACSFSCCFCLSGSVRPVHYRLLHLPSLPYPEIPNPVLRYGFNTLVFLGCIAAFYWFRYGGTFWHDDKPEWDTIPSVVKKTSFLPSYGGRPGGTGAGPEAQAEPAYEHTDEEDLSSLEPFVTTQKPLRELPEPAYGFPRTAQGPRITKPTHIFLFVGETYLQQLFDPQFACLNLVSGGRQLMDNPHTAALTSALSAGIISRPSIVSLMSGIFDAGLELNEKESFWQNDLPTALPRQLKKLGYHSTYWYGGNVTYGNFNRFAPACGFDQVMTATDFCGPEAPKPGWGVRQCIPGKGGGINPPAGRNQRPLPVPFPLYHQLSRAL